MPKICFDIEENAWNMEEGIKSKLVELGWVPPAKETSQLDIEVDSRKCLMGELGKYCHFAWDGDYIEVTEWVNGEGVDVLISRRGGEEKFSFTHGEWDLLYIMMTQI